MSNERLVILRPGQGVNMTYIKQISAFLEKE
jgi:hypothetical protein